MSQTEDDHWRDPPKDRVDPDYPPHLTDRFNEIDYSEEDTIIYDNGEDPKERWVKGVAMPLDSML